MRARHALALGVAVALGLAPWAGADETLALIGDPEFRLGFKINVTTVGTRHIERVVRTGDAAPVWTIAQWSCRHTLATRDPERIRNGWRLRDPGKHVVFNTAPDAEADLTLGMDARREYPQGHRGREQFWPHLLVQQSFATAPRLTEIEALHFRLDARLNFDERVEGPDYDPAIHATQCLAYFTVQNRNRDSGGFGDFLWLGVLIYDDRKPEGGKVIEGDVDLGKLIYHPLRSFYTSEGYVLGAWQRFEADLYPAAKIALEEAWNRGFLKDSRDPADYAVTYMNLGWEIPGVHHVEIDFRNLALNAVLRR